MNGLSKRLVSLTMATAMVFSLTAVPSTEASAATSAITSKTTSVQADKEYTYTIKASKAKTVKVSVSGTAAKAVTVNGKKATSGKNTLTLKGGKTLTVKVKVKPTKTVAGKKFVLNYKLSSSKKAVKTKSIKVNYSTKGVTLDQTAVSLKVGETATLKATMTTEGSNSKIKDWASSNDAVATVKDGVVTAVAAGTADITVTTSNGKTATATVTVEEKKEEVTKFGITATATKADTIVVTADKELSSAATVVVTKEGLTTPVVSSSITPNGKEITFVSKTNFTVGNYTVKVTDGTAEAETTVAIQAQAIAEIVINSTTALLALDEDGDTDDKTAYVYYDVKDQYGESMRNTTSIEWTTSAAGGVTDDRTTGKLTIKASKDDDNTKFTYGNPIYIVGVDGQSGKTVQKNLTIGLAQSLDTVESVGFVNSLDVPSKLSEVTKTLPGDFSKNVWYLLYETKDQEGNLIEGTNNNVDKGRVTFISDNYTLLKMGTSNDNGNGVAFEKTFTIEGIVYSAILVQPGLYVDKGGEVTITAISNKTGKQKDMNFSVGTNAVLQKLSLTAPEKTVADGDQWVKLDYTAVDTNGNKVENYETIVRSTNSLNLSVTEGTLTIKEDNDGKAAIYWSDDAEYAYDFSKGTACDDVARPVAITTTVVGGESSTLMLNVKDARRPVGITNVNGGKTVYAEADTFTFAPFAGNGSVEYVDQYNETLNNNIVNAFFEYTADSKFKGYYYGVKVNVEDESLLYSGGESLGDAVLEYGQGYNGTIKETGNNKATSKNIKFSIVQTKKDEPEYKDYSDAGKVLSITYDYVPVKVLSNITMSAISTQQATTGAEKYANGALAGLSIKDNNLVMGGVSTNTCPEEIKFETNGKDSDILKITGTYKNSTVTVPTAYVDADESVFTTTAVAGGFRITGVSGNAIKWADLYDVNTSYFARKVTSKTMKVAVYDTTAYEDNEEIIARANPSVTVKVSDEPSYIAKITLKNGENQTVNPWMTGYELDWDFDFAGGKVVVLDQYDNSLAEKGVELTYTLADVAEASTELTHVANSLQISASGTHDAKLEGAEIGDKFKLTVTATLLNVNSMSVNADVKLGSDGAAKISTNKDASTDEDFRKDCLNYDR